MEFTEIQNKDHTSARFLWVQGHILPQMMRIVMAIAIVVATVALTAPSTAYAEDGVHVVSVGENLGTIAQLYNVTLRDLINNNGINNPDIVVVGQRLTIPGMATEKGADVAEKVTAATKTLPYGDGYYIVRRGDTLSQIARTNGMALSDMLRLNGLNNANFLWVGQKLRVTARVAPIADDEEVEPKLAETIYIVKQGDTLETVANANNMTLQALLSANGLPHENFTWAGQRLRIHPGAKPPAGGGTNFNAAPSDGYRWIEVNLSNQTLTAWQGDVAVLSTYISSGVAATPTVTGRFRIGTKYPSQRMIGPGYDLPGVTSVMYFYGAYAIHGAYWHNNFGMPMSHGCVNMRDGEAAMLYNWAPAGTEVYVHY